MRTSAPKDLRAAKKERTEGRKTAKEKKKGTDIKKKGKGKATLAVVAAFHSKTSGNKLPKFKTKWKRKITISAKRTLSGVTGHSASS